jgi:hypothetical protein
MLANILSDIREENAQFARDVEYLKETSSDDIIDERLERAEESVLDDIESYEELKTAKENVDHLSDIEDTMEESAELEKILNATEDLTFEEMVGIK